MDIGSLPLTFAAKFMLASALHGMAEMTRAIGIMRELCAMLSGELERARLGAAGIPGSIVRSYLCWFLVEVGGYEEGQISVARGLEIARARKGALFGDAGASRDGPQPYSVEARPGGGRVPRDCGRPYRAQWLQRCLAAYYWPAFDSARKKRAGRTRRAEWWKRGSRVRKKNTLDASNCTISTPDTRRRFLGLAGSTKRSPRSIRALAIGRAIKNPCLIVQGLGLRVRFRGAERPAADSRTRSRGAARTMRTPRPGGRRCRGLPVGEHTTTNRALRPILIAGQLLHLRHRHRRPCAIPAGGRPP